MNRPRELLRGGEEHLSQGNHSGLPSLRPVGQSFFRFNLHGAPFDGGVTMRADTPRALWAGILLALALLSTGCMSLTPPPGQGMNLRYTPREAAAPVSAEWPGVEAPRALAATTESDAPERLHRRRASREEVSAMGPDSTERDARQGALAAQLAFRRAVLDPWRGR